MNYYSREQIINLESEKFAFIQNSVSKNVLYITIDRAEKKNAIHPQMLNEIAFALAYAHYNNDIWAIVIQANGDVFCAGADLKAFMGNIGNFDSSIIEPKEKILMGELFSKIHKPIISKIEGNVYAGGLFFVANSTYVLASDNVIMQLPEVKRGLFPFQVMASLLKILPDRTVLDLCIRASRIDANRAKELNLITHLCKKDNIDDILNNLLEEIKENSPSAIKLGLEAYEHINKENNKDEYLMQMLQKTIMTKDAMEGIQAFKEKRKAIWKGE
jgi:enoyl-CoA hydratase/carnithine racemase